METSVEIRGRSGWSFGLWLWGCGQPVVGVVAVLWMFGYEHSAPDRVFRRYRYRYRYRYRFRFRFRFRNRHGDLTVSPCILHVPDRDGLVTHSVLARGRPKRGFRIRMGRYPAEIAEGAEVYWEGERDLHWSRFQQLPWSTESVSLKITPKSRLQSMEPTHPDRLVENVTAPSAGGFQVGWGGLRRDRESHRGRKDHHQAVLITVLVY